jgi:glyoxylase-like metal-dependent hydrolase (beta-lactamase superfamily II)
LPGCCDGYGSLVAVQAIIVPVTAFQQNCSIVWDEASRFAAVVDPGGEVERILAELEDQFLIDQLPAQAERYGFPPSTSFAPDRWLSDGDRVDVGGEQFSVTHCPGHTHVVFFNERRRYAWVGDVLFAGSIGRSDLPRGNHQVLVHSIRRKLFPLGDDVTFVPGHGPTSTFGRERRTNPFVADRLFPDSA